MKNDIASGVEVVYNYIYIYTIQYSESNDGATCLSVSEKKLEAT